jgi:hypothetical protein
MMFDLPKPFAAYHPLGCQCDDCHPAAPSDDSSVVGNVCLLMLGGAFAAVPIAAAIDALTTRVGLLSIFGG